MTSKEYLFFVCTTPFQLSYVNLIVKSHFPSKNFHKVLYSSILLEKEFYNNFDEVFIADKNEPFKKLLVTFKAIKRIKHISNNNVVKSFFSHTGGLVANFCYQVLVLRKAYSFSLVYEGILSFYEYREQKSKKHTIRKFVSLFYGFKYVFSELVVPLESNYLINIYTPFPELTLGNISKKCRVTFDRKHIDSRCNHSLIIGNLIRIPEDIQTWEKSIDKIKKINANAKVFFKKHPDDQTDQLGNLLMSHGIDANEIVSTQPVESLVEKYCIEKVFSLQISSALFNLRSIYGSKIILYYVRNEIKQLQYVFRAADELDMKEL